MPVRWLTLQMSVCNFSRVSSDCLGMARVPPPPSSAYWPPHSHVRFFSDNTSEPVLVRSSPHPPCFLTGFRRRQRRDCHTHTHTHGSQPAEPGSHRTPSVRLLHDMSFTWPRKSFFGDNGESSLWWVNCVRCMRQGVPKRTAAAAAVQRQTRVFRLRVVLSADTNS